MQRAAAVARDTDTNLSSEAPDERARAAIRAAFIALAGEHGYRGVRIADVAERAGMSRQNLYRYYRNREELYRATLDELFDRFWLQAEPLFEHFDDSQSERINLMAMVVAEQHPHILRLLADPEQHDLSLSLLRRYYARVLGALARHQQVDQLDRDRMNMLVSIAAGASLAGLREWVESDFRLPAGQMANMMSHIFNGRLVGLVSYFADAK